MPRRRSIVSVRRGGLSITKRGVRHRAPPVGGLPLPAISLVAVIVAISLSGCAATLTPTVAAVTGTATPSPTATHAPSAEPVPAWRTGMTEAVVARVVDGDTIVVAVGGAQEKVRYIGVDAPEGTEAGTPGGSATEANRALVEGQTVYLEGDTSDRDPFGRLLRYVWLADGRLVNEELVRLGMARSSAYPPDTARQEQLAAAQETAIARYATMSISAVSLRGSGEAQPDEYIELTNSGTSELDVGGWRVEAGLTEQFFVFPEGFALQPGEVCRLYTDQVAADSCGGYTFGYDCPILNNDGDCGQVYNAAGVLVAELCVE